MKGNLYKSGVKTIGINGTKTAPSENGNIDIAVFDDIIRHSSTSPDSSVLNGITTPGVYRLCGGIEAVLLVSKYQTTVYQVIFKTLNDTFMRRIFYKNSSGNFVWSGWTSLMGVGSVSVNGKKISPDENKNVDVTAFDGKVPVTNESFFESIPWKIADGVHKLVTDWSNGIQLGGCMYEGILISVSHTRSIIKWDDMITAGDYNEKYITQTLIYTQSGEKTEIKTRNACILTLQKTGELYKETYGDWEDAVDLSGCVKVSDAANTIGKFTVTPVISSVTAKFAAELIYPFEYDGYRIFVNGKEITDGKVAKGEGFVTAPAVFDGSNVKVQFYANDYCVFATDLVKLGAVMNANGADIGYGVLLHSSDGYMGKDEL